MARGTIKASEKALVDVFCDKYRFSIPPYQRPYAWTTEEAGELFDDLKLAMGEGDPTERPPYFLGSIVLIKDPQKPEADVVDGQQRLTTLTIILAVLRDVLDGKLHDRAHNYICEEGDPFAGTQDRYRLRLRERDAQYFEDVIQVPRATRSLPKLQQFADDARSRMVENAQLSTDQVKALTDGQRKDLMTFMIQRCFLVVVEASDADSAYRVFSVMNDRGLDLSPTDILKAEIIGAMPTSDRESYTDIWEELEEELGRDAFRDLFAHIRMIHRRAKMAGSLEAEFRRYVEPTKDPQSFINDTLKPLANAYLAVIHQDFESARRAEDINRTLRHLSMLDNADWQAPAILYVSKFKNDPDAVAMFLEELERLAYGLFVSRANINDRLSRYGRLIKAIQDGEDLYTDESPLDLTKTEISNVLRQLDGPIYEIKRIRMPVLLRLDEALSDGSASYDHRIITVEHVLPQTPEEGGQWLEWFPNDEEREAWTHRLANLVLLSRAKNSQAQNFAFDRKKTEYFARRGTSPFAITTQVLNTQTWTPEVLEERQRDVIGVLKALWQLGT